jgi:hypothetical protein
LVQTNVNVNNIRVDGEHARRQLENAFIRLIEARRESVGDPAAYVDGEQIIEHEPQAMVPRLGTAEPRPATADLAPGSNSENLNISNSGTPAHTGPCLDLAGGGQKKSAHYSNSGPSVPGLFAGAAMDGSDDNRSTTEKYLSWPGHNRPP